MNKQPPKLIELIELQGNLYDGWLKNLSALSIVALTILVGLLTKEPLPSPDKYFLVACWCLLGISILGSLIGSYLPIAVAGLNVHLHKEPHKWQVGEPFPKGWKTYRLKLLSFCQKTAIVSFFLAFVNLVVFACLTTLKT